MVFPWLFVMISWAWSADEFLIRDGDRVVFWGDSITDNAYYPRSVENFVISRCPKWNVEFHNLGWGGDRTTTLERMKRDLPQYNPTLVTIKLGMNDGSYMEFTQENFDKYINGYCRLLDFLREATTARIVLITTVPYETDVMPVRKRNNQDFDMSVYNDTLRRFSDGVVELAKEYKADLIDLNALYAQMLKESKAKDSGFKLSGDAIHPNVNGQAYMAYFILMGLHAPGAIADVIVDAKAKTIVQEKGAFIRNLKCEGDQISFTRQDRALPFRFSSEDQFDARVIQKEKWYNDLNRDRFTVKNLPQPYALLSMDGEAIAVLSREQLEAGINLSLLPNSPMLKHGALLADMMTEIRHKTEYTRWRHYLLSGVGSPNDFTPYKPESIYTQFLKETADFFHQAQLKYNDPVPHDFALTCGEKETLEKSLKK